LEPASSSPSSLLSHALSLYQVSLRLLEEGVGENSMLKMRDAASLAWEAVVEAVDALILKSMGRLPRSHFERRRALRSVEVEVPKLAARGLYERFMARSRLFRGELLHEDVLDMDLLRFEVLKAGELLDLVKEGLQA